MLDTRETKWPATHHTGVGMLQVEEIALEARETTQGPRTDTCFVPTTLTGELELVLALLSHQPVTWLVLDHSSSILSSLSFSHCIHKSVLCLYLHCCPANRQNTHF